MGGVSCLIPLAVGDFGSNQKIPEIFGSSKTTHKIPFMYEVGGEASAQYTPVLVKDVL